MIVEMVGGIWSLLQICAVVSYWVVFNSGAGLQVWRGSDRVWVVSSDCALGAGGEDQLGECLQTGGCGWGAIWAGWGESSVCGRAAGLQHLGRGGGQGAAFIVHLLTWRDPKLERCSSSSVGLGGERELVCGECHNGGGVWWRGVCNGGGISGGALWWGFDCCWGYGWWW